MPIYLILFLSIFWVPIVQADDAVEAAVPGGIVFEKTPELLMQEEVLKISKLKTPDFTQGSFNVEVDFNFKNTSNTTITRKIAFVLPPVECKVEYPTNWRGFKKDDSPDRGLKDFKLTVNDKPTTFTIRHEAMLGKKNITQLLQNLNIPLNPCEIKIEDDSKTDKQYRTTLEKNHLLEYDFPAWSEHIYFEWEQTFPAQGTVHVHHQYTPVYGASVPAGYSLTTLKEWIKRNNPNYTAIWNNPPNSLPTTHPTIKMKDSDELRFCLSPMWVRYKLTTGAYWTNGIGKFTLIIKDEKDGPFAINKFYTYEKVELTKTADTMTFVAKNFTPRTDLMVLFLSLPQTDKELKICGIE